jgi:hypothetical protein
VAPTGRARQLGTFPTMDASRTLDMAPVDYVAKAIAAITLNSAAPVDNYNVCRFAVGFAVCERGARLLGTPV